MRPSPSGGRWIVQTTDGNTGFAAVYGRLIRGTIATPNSGDREVRLFRETGINSFADGDAVYDGVCEACHTKTRHHRNDGTAVEQSHYDGTRWTSCHTHANGFGGFEHSGGESLPVSDCMQCHGSLGSDLIVACTAINAGSAIPTRLGGGPLVEPYESTRPSGGNCTDCHGNFSNVHQSIDHTATPGSGAVLIFSNTDHDDAGWTGDKPYFDVYVDCGICHSSDLPAIHGNDCATCHPTPYDTLGGYWERGCQQGGCHTEYHSESTTAHLPFEDAYTVGIATSATGVPGT